jgi:hypothetical protein
MDTRCIAQFSHIARVSEIHAMSGRRQSLPVSPSQPFRAEFFCDCLFNGLTQHFLAGSIVCVLSIIVNGLLLAQWESNPMFG